MKMDDRMLPEIGTDPDGKLKKVRVFALDMDGTVYLDETWIEGARDWLDRIEKSGRTYYFLTNNSSKDPHSYVDKLHRMGLKIPEDRIVTSGQAAIWYLQQHYAGRKVFLLGNPILQREFREAGIELAETESEEWKQAEVVVTGFDTSLTYRKMCCVCDLVRAGLPYIATHPDFNCPTATGFVPDIGSIQAFIKASAFRDPDIIIGKPNKGIDDYLLMRIGETVGRQGADAIRSDEVAMVGDRLYTDIAAGVNGGFTSILVLSGEATMEDAGKSDVKPDLIYRAVKDIPL